MTEWEQRVYAIAGINQAAACIHQLAYQGTLFPTDAAAPLFHSVLAIDAPSITAIYAGAAEDKLATPPLRVGLQIFIDQFNSAKPKNNEQIQHVLNILRMERVLDKNAEAKQALGKGLMQVARQKNDFNMDQYRINESLAGLYSSIISPLARPIQIKGKQELLKQSAIQNQIRSLLLAGIRSAVLWRQVGGKKRHFIFNRRQMLEAANSLLSISSYQRSQS